MVTNYRKGYAFELRVRNVFREFGLQAERQPGSKPFDIIVFKGGEIKFVIDAKKTGKEEICIKKKDVEHLVESAKRVGAYPLIIYSTLNSQPFVALPSDLLQSARESVRLAGGMGLKDFLYSYLR